MIKQLLYFTGLLLLVSCSRQEGSAQLFAHIEEQFNEGNMDKVYTLVDSLKEAYPEEKSLIKRADSVALIAERISLEFPFGESEIMEGLKKAAGDYSRGDIEKWESQNWLECRVLDSEKRYFKRALSNLELIKSFHHERAARDSALAEEAELLFRKKHTQSVIRASGDRHEPVRPVEMLVNYTLTLQANVVPDGEIVRCWLPWPREDMSRQANVRFISASEDDYTISPDTTVHRTIYMETTAKKDEPVVFNVSFSYDAYGQYFNPDNIEILPYDTASALYREFTNEELPHINFSEDVRELADSITGQLNDPVEVLRSLYYWMNENIPWAGALEYSVMPDIPGYVINNRRGDCGMQTFLLISMLRYRGIPARWQSGWMMPPGNENLHDWCEIYFESVGWVPVDMSYGLQYSTDRKTREFYMSGIDSYRLIVNKGVAGDLYPEKKHLRSEPYDFQRGEVEWSGGNLYFDSWDYKMTIDYID